MMTTKPTLDEKYDTMFRSTLRPKKGQKPDMDLNLTIGSRPNTNMMVSDMLAKNKPKRVKNGKLVVRRQVVTAMAQKPKMISPRRRSKENKPK